MTLIWDSRRKKMHLDGNGGDNEDNLQGGKTRAKQEKY